MNLIFWVLTVAAIYCFLVYCLSRFAVPYMGWLGFALPAEIPSEIQNKITELENQSPDQISYLRAVYDFIMDKNNRQWHHTRLQAATRFPRAFIKDLDEIWSTNDFVYCTSINYLAFVMLVGSRFFRPADIKVRHVFVNFFIHQYIKVKVGNSWIDFDPAGTGIRGKPLGTHLWGFG